MKESNYWLRIIDAILDDKTVYDNLKYLIMESGQLEKILGSIVVKTRPGNK